MRRAWMSVAAILVASPVLAAYQVRYLPVKVAPYFEAADYRATPPRISTASGFDPLFLSSSAQDVGKVPGAIRADPAGVSPITMMVLAVRLYDVGLRDEAVFWFHVARDRMATASAVLDTGFAEVARVEAATRAFAQQAGPHINGYSLCDVDRHRRVRREALDWVEKNPYAMIFVEAIPAKPGDRRANLASALRDIRAEVADEGAALAAPAGLAKLAASRRDTEADAKYCWK